MMRESGNSMAEMDQAHPWVESVLRELGRDSAASQSDVHVARTVGLMSGSNASVDGRVLEFLTSRLASGLDASDQAQRLLLVKLDVFLSRDVGRAADQPASLPVAVRSPLGPWSEVAIPMPVGPQASWSLEQLPTWLPIWKRTFDFVLISLGPVNLTPSRVAGRYCDECFVIVGPGKSASAAWLKRHIDWHQDCGNSVRGTLVSTYSHADSLEQSN